MTRDAEKTKVIFRADKRGQWRGNVTAVFPQTLGAMRDAITMVCYAHVGQHSTCTTGWLVHETRRATPKEYAALKEELESIGYNLKVSQMMTRADYLRRLEQMK